jgi:hypothetical protein
MLEVLQQVAGWTGYEPSSLREDPWAERRGSSHQAASGGATKTGKGTPVKQGAIAKAGPPAHRKK